MDRRVAGVLVLLVVLLMAAVAPNLSGRRVVGDPQRVPVPVPPTVGACVVHLDGPRVDTATGMVDPHGNRAAEFGPCSGPVVGEVVQVGDLATAGNIYDSGGCWWATLAYAGSAVPSRAETSGPTFLPMVQFQPVAVSPRPQELVAGAHWSACVATPLIGGSYVGSLRGGAAGGRLPVPYTACRMALSSPRAEVPCTAPHTTEVLGRAAMPNLIGASVNGVRVLSEYADRCREFAALRLGREDPTVHGQLTVDLDTDPSSPEFGACRVTTGHGRTLVGSVVGLGQAPLLWS